MASLALPWTDGLRVSSLVEAITGELGPACREALTAENVRVAVNQELIQEDTALQDGDEVAYFPPVTGG